MGISETLDPPQPPEKDWQLGVPVSIQICGSHRQPLPTHLPP